MVHEMLFAFELFNWESPHIWWNNIWCIKYLNWKQSIIENSILFCWIIFVIGKLPFFIVIGSAKYIRNSPDALFFVTKQTGESFEADDDFMKWCSSWNLVHFKGNDRHRCNLLSLSILDFLARIYFEFPRNILVVFWPCCLLVYNLGSKNTSPRLFFWRKRIGQVKMVTSTTFCYSYKTESSFQRK